MVENNAFYFAHVKIKVPEFFFYLSSLFRSILSLSSRTKQKILKSWIRIMLWNRNCRICRLKNFCCLFNINLFREMALETTCMLFLSVPKSMHWVRPQIIHFLGNSKVVKQVQINFVYPALPKLIIQHRWEIKVSKRKG